MIEVTFNGVKLSDYIRVTEVIRPIGNNRELTLSENLSIGATVTKTRRGVKEHVIKFDIDTKDAREREELKHVLAGIGFAVLFMTGSFGLTSKQAASQQMHQALHYSRLTTP